MNCHLENRFPGSMKRYLAKKKGGGGRKVNMDLIHCNYFTSKLNY